MANYIKLYYFAYLSVDNSFLRITLNAEEDGLNYRVIGTEERPPSSLIWRGKWKNRIVPKDDIDRLQGAFLYEMFCTENDSLPLLRKLFLMYKNYYDETKEKLAEIENHMKVIANEALKPI